MGIENEGGGGDASPAVENLGGDVPSRFEEKMSQIRCLFQFLGFFYW